MTTDDWKREGQQPRHPWYHKDISHRFSLDAITEASSGMFEATNESERAQALLTGQEAIVSAIHEQTYVLKEAIDALREVVERRDGGRDI